MPPEVVHVNTELNSNASPRPVYVLGAGFSRAVNQDMPLMNDLGHELQSRLDFLGEESSSASVNFEDWLNVRVTALPFLKGWQNASRSAQAERIIAEIAAILDERTNAALSTASPAWLLRLVELWHAENAAVVTFNYDPLVESAINEAGLIHFHSRGANRVLADTQVFPAPPAPPAVYYLDNDSPNSSSLQLLKLHGSLNWYWSSGDRLGTTLSRTRERRTFAGRRVVPEPEDFTGTKMLDRFLVPPVSTKSAYYSPYLTNALWRSAHDHISRAKSLTIIGYSLPKTDQVGTELLATVPREAQVRLIDFTPGNQDDDASLAGRVNALNGSIDHVWSGARSVPDFVQSLSQELSGKLFDVTPTKPDADVLVALPVGAGDTSEPSIFIACRTENGNIGTVDIDFPLIARSQMPPRAMAFNSLPAGYREFDSFIRVGRLREMLDAGVPPTVIHNDREFLIVSIEYNLIGPWDVALLTTSEERPLEHLSPNVDD